MVGFGKGLAVVAALLIAIAAAGHDVGEIAEGDLPRASRSGVFQEGAHESILLWLVEIRSIPFIGDFHPHS
jgi:hypothetical protein